ncbi:hypothetical protein [Aliagarivorans taiwanensis]|uniref:hypothetical protein n=1 Tax=Aliagarivorans taiwanensis TaxID=561966 RepID=UPI0005570742|nr:hypothetical protein [Aliagarivorans taiwanensis]
MRLIRQRALVCSLLTFTLLACQNTQPDAEVRNGYPEVAGLGESLVAAKLALYSEQPDYDYSELIEYGLDTRYGVFVRAWLDHELLMIAQYQQLRDAPELEARERQLRTLKRAIDLE